MVDEWHEVRLPKGYIEAGDEAEAAASDNQPTIAEQFLRYTS